MRDDRPAELAIVHSEIIGCIKCELHKSRKNAVPGEGPADAKIMFVGEGPGLNEDEQGRPFVGAAGKLLTELLESVGLSRSEVFITNIVKCRPPSNRAPRKPEIEACNPYLISQIRLIEPRIVCALGTPAIATLLGEEFSATKVHGRPMMKGDVTVLPMYHPAAALYDASLKEVLARDFRILKDILTNTSARDGPVVKSGQEKERESLERWA
jgi:uracil-DNA glycosylase